MNFGVIGGTGFYSLVEDEAMILKVATPYGIVEVDQAKVGEEEIAFVTRHGKEHTTPPHRVNYRGNIAGLKALGVQNILASASVGSMAENMPPGSLVLLDQFLDFTHARPSTFHDGEKGASVVHVDMTEPYCKHLRNELLEAAHILGQTLLDKGTYVCVEGPRFETAAEIKMFRGLGGDVVGMTNVPEVVLAREAGICYAAVAVVCNWAAGISSKPLKHEEVSSYMSEQTPWVRELFGFVIQNHKEIDCSCRAKANP